MNFFKVFIQLFCKQKNGWNSNEGGKNILGHQGWTKSMEVASCSGREWYGRSQLHSIICPCPHYLLEILHSSSIHLVCRNSRKPELPLLLNFSTVKFDLLGCWIPPVKCWMAQSPPSLAGQSRLLLFFSTPKRMLRWRKLIWMTMQNSAEGENRSFCNYVLVLTWS